MENRDVVLECCGFSSRMYNTTSWGGREHHSKGTLTATFMGADGVTVTLNGWRGPLTDRTKIRVRIEQVDEP